MDPATERLTALLAPLTNYERKRPDRPRWSLDNMRQLLRQPGFEMPRAPLVQVGGSKGKGTTSLYLESLARAAGARTGTYLSPHLHSLLERVRIDGRLATEEELTPALVSVLEYARECDLEITFFEAMTRAALSCFAAQPLDLVVLEVGLGGRLDATTAVEADAVVLTSIELEHTDLLGDTIEAIAGEKAAILRPGRPAFTAVPDGAALDVLRARAAEVGADLAVVGEHFGIEDVRVEGVSPAGTGFCGVLLDGSGGRRRFHMPDARGFELPALELAVACLSRLDPALVPPLEPVPQPALPGRCEVLTCSDGHPLVLDGAHTEGSAAALAGELDRRFPGQRMTLLFASAQGKRWREALKCLLGRADRVVVTALTDTTTESRHDIAEWLASQGVPCEEAPGVDAGLRRLAEYDGLRVVTGSFHLVGEARSCSPLLGDPRLR